MTTLSIDVSEVRALATRISGAGARIGATGASLLRRTAYAIEGDGKALAAVDTGAMRSSVSTTFTGDGRNGTMTAEIGPTVEYAVYVEHGTSTQSGQPFMGPAFDRQAPGYEAALAQAAAGQVL